MEIGSGASQGGIHERCHEALSEDGKMILLINQTSIGREGGLLGGVLAYQETGLTGPLSIYKVLPKVVKAATTNLAWEILSTMYSIGSKEIIDRMAEAGCNIPGLS